MQNAEFDGKLHVYFAAWPAIPQITRAMLKVHNVCQVLALNTRDETELIKTLLNQLSSQEKTARVGGGSHWRGSILHVHFAAWTATPQILNAMLKVHSSGLDTRCHCTSKHGTRFVWDEGGGVMGEECQHKTPHGNLYLQKQMTFCGLFTQMLNTTTSCFHNNSQISMDTKRPRVSLATSFQSRCLGNKSSFHSQSFYSSHRSNQVVSMAATLQGFTFIVVHSNQLYFIPSNVPNNDFCSSVYVTIKIGPVQFAYCGNKAGARQPRHQ